MSELHSPTEKLVKKSGEYRRTGVTLKADAALDAALGELTAHVYMNHPGITHADDADLWEQHEDAHREWVCSRHGLVDSRGACGQCGTELRDRAREGLHA